MDPARGSTTETETVCAGCAAAGRKPHSRRARGTRVFVAVALAGMLLAWVADAALVPSSRAAAGAIRGNSVSVDAPAINAPPRIGPAILAKRVTTARHTGKATIGLFTAHPATLSPDGGTVQLLAVVQSATSCRFSSSNSVEHLPATKDCSSGTATLELKLPRNTGSQARTFHFQLTVRNRAGVIKSAPVSVLERATGAPVSAPLIQTQPANTTAVAGSTVTFTAASAGRASIQWEVSTDGGRSWGDIVGATSPSYSFVATSAENGYEYRAQFSSSGGYTTTGAATLTVTPLATPASVPQPDNNQPVIPAPAAVAPSVTLQPSYQGVLVGSSASFTAAASGDPTPGVQWQVSTDGGNTWADVSNASSSTYTFNPALGENGYEYRAVFTNSAGSVPTGPALLTVATSDQGPTVTLSPQSQSVVADNAITFSAAATGVPTPSVQWQTSIEAGPWTDVSGATSTTYTFTATPADSGEQLRAEFSNSAGTVDTAVATLTVSDTAIAPTVTLAPTNVVAVAGTSATFTATASGSPTPTIQWQVSPDGSTWTNIAGATSTSYTFTALLQDNEYEYRALFFNSAAPDGQPSPPAVLTVTEPPAPAQITGQPANQAIVAGYQVTFSAAASGNPQPTVQWQVSTDQGTTWSDAAGATSQAYTFTAEPADNGFEYRAEFSNPSGPSAYTNAATLTVGVDDNTNNWSGYADVRDGPFSSVSGSWTVPQVNCTHGESAYSSDWIGIDGADASDKTVEQDGTDSDCTASGPYYYAWYELYPAPESSLPDPVAAGDVMSASVSVSGSTWTLYIHDDPALSTTPAWTESVALSWAGSPAPVESSAEWIVERPEVCSGSCGSPNDFTLTSLANFGSVNFSGAAANGTPISILRNVYPIEMTSTNEADLLALPGPIAGDGFTDTWLGSS